MRHTRGLGFQRFALIPIPRLAEYAAWATADAERFALIPIPRLAE